MPLVNGDFETGDLTGWTDAGSVSGDSCAQDSHVDVDALYEGSYGLLQATEANDSADNPHALVTQTFSSAFISISFRYKVYYTNTVEGAVVKVTISVLDEYEAPYDYPLLWVGDVAEGDWIQISKTKAEIEAGGYHFDTTTTLKVGSYVEVYE